MKFKEMNLPDFIMQSLEKQGFAQATEIQERTIPLIEAGVDVIGLSQTGSGKTYAYGIPAIQSIDHNLPATQVLIICPTRELVAQVVDDLKKLTAEQGRIRIQPIFGGSNMDRQKQALKRGAKIVVGTPGRLMDHLRQKTLRLDYLRTVVLDEADEMLNMGFKPDIETILKSTKPERQTVMFSATMPAEIQKLTTAFMRSPVTIKSANQDCSHAAIEQYYVNCKRTEKVEMLEKILQKTNPFVSIVFCNTKKMVDDLAHKLKQSNHPAVAIHGDMRQRERSKTMDDFKKNGGILVATDVAARGIDVKNVDIVVNFDFPNNDEYYTHRIGRTGRAGKSGTAFTIVNTLQQSKALSDLARKLSGKITEHPNLSSTSFLADEPDKKKSRKKSNNYKPKHQHSNNRPKSHKAQHNKKPSNHSRNRDNKRGNSR